MKGGSVISWAALLAAIAVMLGALGAHALKPVLEADQLESLNTAIRYQMFHSLALLALGVSGISELCKWSVRLMITGTLLFSFSIYGLVFFRLIDWPYAFLGPITPIGGLLLIASWLTLIFENRKRANT